MEGNYQITFVSKKKNFDTIEDKDCADTIEAINNKKSMILSITLSGNSYSKEFCDSFSRSLQACSNLKKLNLNDIFVGRKKDEIPFSLEFLTKSLVGNPNFIAIDLSNNAVGPNGAAAISYFLENSPNLRTLLINNCGLGIQGATIIANALRKGKVNLEVIAMARNRLENPGAIEIASALSEMSNIKEVHLFQDVIRKDGMIPLLKSLVDKNIKTLDISDNFINEEAVPVFCEFIKKNESIINLNVSDCNIQEDDNEAIIDAFEQSNAKFEKVGYNHNELIDTELAKKFLDNLLAKNPNIKRIDIKGNEFKKAAKAYYTEKVGERECLSKFESDDEEDEEDIIKEFEALEI